MKISVIVPTLNRPGDLRAALDSILRQTLLPYEVLVVDQSPDDRSRRLVEELASRPSKRQIRFRHVVQQERSLVKARNRGLDLAEGDLISFLDDDVVLLEDYFEQVVRVMSHDRSLGGVSGSVIVGRKLHGIKWELRRFLMRMFLLNGFDGRMTGSGFGYPVFEREIDQPILVEMLPGCDMNFRREVVDGERFDEWFTGYSFREDVDFSYRISRKAKCAMIPDARLYHNYSTGNRLDAGKLKKMEVRNYYYLSRKHRGGRPFSGLLFAYSLAGLIAIDLLEFLTSWQPVKFRKFSAGLSSSFGILLMRNAHDRA